MINGKLVYLDPIEQEDLELLRKWRNNVNFRQYFREYREIGRDAQLAWYNGLKTDKSTLMFAIRLKETGELLGCCGLCYINWVNRNADFSLYIGYKDLSIDDLGYADEATKLLMGYGFGELGLEKIWTEIYEIDHPKMALYKANGFAVDGVLRHNYFHDGKFLNSYILSILKDDFARQ